MFIYILNTTDIFRTKNDIPRIFYDAVNMIHDVITTAKLFSDTAKLMFDGVRNNKPQQMRR